ncbi:MAG: IS1380 family transposase [Saprospiraceae bacterium]
MCYKIEYSDDKVSAWGGFSLMKKFNDKIGLKSVLQNLHIPESKSNNRFENEEIIESFLLSVWLGCYKFSHTHVLRLDDTLKKIFGWKQIPSDTTYKRFFQKFNQGINNEVLPVLQEWFFNQLQFDSYVLDLDSTVITRYGDLQEGNHKGYNPTKRGRASHHPLFAFLGNERMVVNSWLRSGDTSSAHQCNEFLNETLSILKNKTIGLLRADSGFASDLIFRHLEQEQIPYVIAGRMHYPLQDKIKQQKTWTAIGLGIWISETRYKASKWESERRVIVIRQSVDLRPKATGKKLKLFDDKEYYEQYRYHTFYTNQTLPATQIWEQYKGRGDCENRIKELKYDFALEGFNMKDFFATEAALRMVNLAYNIISLFRQVSSEKPNHQRLQTLRLNCYAVGAWMTKKGNSRILKLAVPIKKRKWMDGIFGKVDSCSFPLSLIT